MKKKFKLLTSIASLGLALALGVFGVLAATNQTVTITNTVDFEATKNVKALVELAKPSLTGATVKNGAVADAKEVDFDGTEPNDEQTAWALGDLEFVADAGNTGTIVYSYTVTITNKAAETDSAKILVVSVTVPAAKAYADGSHGVEVTATGDLTVSGTTVSGEIVRTESATYTVKITIDANASIADAVNLGSTISLSMK
jgi:hypothetical protein